MGFEPMPNKNSRWTTRALPPRQSGFYDWISRCIITYISTKAYHSSSLLYLATMLHFSYINIFTLHVSCVFDHKKVYSTFLLRNLSNITASHLWPALSPCSHSTESPVLASKTPKRGEWVTLTYNKHDTLRLHVPWARRPPLQALSFPRVLYGTSKECYMRSGYSLVVIHASSGEVTWKSY